MMKLFIFFLLLLPCWIIGQNTSQLVEKPKQSYVFGQVFTDFHYALKDTYDPKAAFNFNQGIIGYRHQLTENLCGIILYDVTRTTWIADTLGRPIPYDYFEGSKYTGFLKMAEIKWDINNWISFRVGQLLNTQYLTFQDRFWGYRYVDVTYQEKFRMGMPADFGAQIDLKWKDKLLNQVSVVNGEGPFRYQDLNGKFIFSNNIQYYPTDRITFKLYTDYGQSPDTGVGKADKSVISGFAGYKFEKIRIGGEYTYVINFGYNDGTDNYGFSVYTGIVLNDQFQLLGRWDHLDLKSPESTESTDYYIAGFQFEPVERFTTALTFRYDSRGGNPFVFASFGLKF